jgi:predicted enzyme related to lactoylglutathione lyase
MRARAHHHPALRVSDIDRAARFYLEVFDGRRLTSPFEVGGAFAEMLMEGPPGVRFRVRHIGFDDGIVELFEFLEPALAAGRVHPTEGNLMHFGIRVPDVAEAVARVVRAGGRALFPPTPFGDALVSYCADPDGNVIELTDASIAEIVDTLVRTIPDAHPDRARAGDAGE